MIDGPSPKLRTGPPDYTFPQGEAQGPLIEGLSSHRSTGPAQGLTLTLTREKSGLDIYPAHDDSVTDGLSPQRSAGTPLKAKCKDP